MKKQINEIRRMQQLAGLIKENMETGFPSQSVMDKINSKYGISVQVWDEGPGNSGYYYEEGDKHAEWDENGTLIYSGLSRIS